MTDPVCDPHAGWQALNTVWSHCRDGEEACIKRAHLIDLSTSAVRMLIFPSWSTGEDVIIPKGGHVDFIEPDGTVWRVHCDGIVTSMNQANIRICYIPSEAPPDPDVIKVGDTVTVDGHSFQLLDLVCGTNARIVARVDGVLQSTTLKAVAGSLLGVFPTVGIAVGGLYVGIKTVGGMCSLALNRMAGGGLTPQDQKDNDNRAHEDHVYPDGTTPTPEETRAADAEAEERTANWLNADYVEKVRQLTNGEITKREFNSWLKETTYQLKLVILDEKYYIKAFSLSIPSIVMSGDVDITGTSPQPNQVVKIMVVKKFLGFDWAAVDQEIASPQSDSNYEYYDTITLNEFGMIEVYGLIGKDWWGFLDKDMRTEKHTVLVITPMILLALLAMLAMVLDKKYNFIGIFKKKRGKK